MTETRLGKGEVLYYCAACGKLYVGPEVEDAGGETREDGVRMRYCDVCWAKIQPRVAALRERIKRLQDGLDRTQDAG